MDFKLPHLLMTVVLVAVGYWLGRKFPSALASIPILGS